MPLHYSAQSNTFIVLIYCNNTKKNCNNEKIKSKLISRNTFYNSVENIWSFSWLLLLLLLLSSSSSSSSSCSWRDRSVILFLNPQDEVGPSTSSLVVPCSFVLMVYTVMLVLVVYLCPSSLRVVASFSGIVLFPLLYSVLLFFPYTLILFFI